MPRRNNQEPIRKPHPRNDPKHRGKRRPQQVNEPPLTDYILSQLMLQDSSDEEASWENIRRILRVLPRDNPNDPHKPYSYKAIHELSEGSPWAEPSTLTAEDEQLIQNYGYDLERCTIFDKPIPATKRPKIPVATQLVLNRYPGWLRSLLETRYDQIAQKYGEKTHDVLRLLCQRLDYQARKLAHLHTEQEDILELHNIDNQFDVEDDYMFIGDDVRDGEGFREQLEEEASEILQPTVSTDDDEKVSKLLVSEMDDAELANQQAKIEFMWSPLFTRKAGDALRAALVAGDSESDDEDLYEEGQDEATYRRERAKGACRFKDSEFTYRGDHWEALVVEKSAFRKEAVDYINEEFMRPDVLKEHRKMKKKEESVQKKADRKAQREIRKSFTTVKGHALLKESGERQKQAALHRERGVGRRPSRLFIRSPCDGPIVDVERELHQSRTVEELRAYANWICASSFFKYGIILVILGNAGLLAFETTDYVLKYNFVFDLLDSFFLSIYVAEFCLKFFASPNTFFKSPFNIFDFIILVVSIFKWIIDLVDWDNEVTERLTLIFRYLAICRAFRILRGISLSVHIQVLVRALVDTLRNHVLTVVILLALLMYITSIMAFYLFADEAKLNATFGKFYIGMLKLFSFVTLDGWTDINQDFEDTDIDVFKHGGRFFCMILVLLGNFLFQNIFVAIIIMQISDATDAFRKRRAGESDIKVSMKQDHVFRRQKLDMRQLLARQRLGLGDDFFELGSRFVRKLRHDDLVDSQEAIFSPLWLDSLYKAMQRSNHTSNIIMNQHRKMADRLHRLTNIRNEGCLVVKNISRARYNNYSHIKSKLRVLKEEFLKLRSYKPKNKVKARYDDEKKRPLKNKSFAFPAFQGAVASLNRRKGLNNKAEGKKGKMNLMRSEQPSEKFEETM